MLWRPCADGWHDFRSAHGACVQTCRKRQLRKGRLGCDFAALITQVRQAAQGRNGQGRHIVKPRVHTPVSRQNRKRNAFSAAQGLDLLQPVRPVGVATDQPDQNALRAVQRLFHVGVDRQGVFQRRQVGKP